MPSFKPESIRKFLKVWSKLALNIRMRDRLVKVIQYGCQMIIGYYSVQLTQKLKNGLMETRRFSSNARKAFWLLKALSHLNTCVTQFESGILHQGTLADKFDFAEQTFLAIYFFLENFVYFIRSQLLPMSEDSIDFYVNASWFGADLSAFISCILRLQYNSAQLKEANQIQLCLHEESVIAEVDNALGLVTTIPDNNFNNNNSNDNIMVNKEITLCKCPPAIREKVRANPDIHQQMVNQQLISKLEEKQRSLQLVFGINLFELLVSCHYVGLYRSVLRVNFTDGPVGMWGVASSVLILYEGTLNVLQEVRQEEAKQTAVAVAVAEQQKKKNV